MEVRIGIQSAPRELVVETGMPADDLGASLRAAVREDGGVFEIADVKGGKVLVPAAKIAYVEFGSTHARRVGFSS